MREEFISISTNCWCLAEDAAFEARMRDEKCVARGLTDCRAEGQHSAALNSLATPQGFELGLRTV